MINKIINWASIIIVLSIFTWYNLNQRYKRIIAERNFAAAELYHEDEIELTKKQAREFYSSTIDSLSRQLSIKPKQVTHWIKGEVEYRDTGSVVYKERPGDTILIYPDSITGIIKKPCYDLNLLLYKGVFYENMVYHDKMTAVIYRERPHKILFIKYGKWKYKAAIISECRNDTIKVTNNIKITN